MVYTNAQLTDSQQINSIDVPEIKAMKDLLNQL
jgi:hypothetical protein